MSATSSGEAQLPEGLGPDSVVGDDANAGHPPAFDGPDVAQVVKEGGDDLLVAAAVLAGVMGRLQGVFELRDSLAVVLRLSGGAEEVENAVGRCRWIASHYSLLGAHSMLMTMLSGPRARNCSDGSSYGFSSMCQRWAGTKR